MFQSSHELLNQYIKQSLQGQDIKNIESIFYVLEKLDNLVIQESIKKIENQEEFVSLKVLFHHKIILITFLFIKNNNTEEIFELIPYLNTLNLQQSQVIISILGGSLGIIIEEGSFISLNQMISNNQMNYEKIKQLAYDLVEQLAILHQQNICLFNFSLNDVYMNLESNKFLIKFSLDLLRVQSDQFIFNYSQNVYMDSNFPIPELIQLDLQAKQFKILNPFLIDSWNLGVLILNTFMKINQETSTDLKHLLEKYFLNVCGIDYILMSGNYYKNQNDLQFLLQENNRCSILQFIKLINCTKLLKLCETNIDGSDEFINLANCCETIKKQYLKGKLLKIKSINQHMINLEFIEDLNQNQLPIHNQIQLTLGQLIINSQIVRVIPHIQIFHNTNKLIMDSHLTDEKLIQIIMIFQDLQIYSIDTESLLLFLQFQNINFKKILKLQKQFQFEIHNLIFYDNPNSQNSLDELLHFFNNFNLNRLEIRQEQIPFNQNEQFAQNIFNKMNLDQIRVLILSNTYLTDQTLQIISTFSSLSNLNLSKCQCLSTQGLCAFFKQSQFCNLVTLDISKTKSDETVFDAVWKNKSYIALTSVNISDCSFINLTLITQTIAQINAKQEKVQELYMSGCDLNNSVLTALQQITFLNCLDLSNNPKLNQFHSLKRDNKYNYLNLEQCEMKSQDIIYILNLECLIKSKLLMSSRQNTSIYNIQINQRSISLTNFQVKNIQIDQDVSEIKFINVVLGQKRVFLSLEFNKLSILQLQNCQIDDKDVSILSQNLSLNQLQELNLNQNNLSDSSLITVLSTFKQLINLGFDNSKITKNSIQYIIASNLKILSIRFCLMLQAEDILSLLTNLDNQIEHLNLSYNKINSALKQYLQNEKLNFTIIFDQSDSENVQTEQHIQSFNS
ncbi:unnamed protein product (macronuclear) [Paramecium tetraurelia]|uniref:Protein kinase domain-containing protein n=1 Tax=Paramecium tetraurelia TaxID=5888 RepID=A0CN11_PARTE|nr:uncharacterized protein GSPATT00008619001 [Paramecium tetraurelia]CAK72178.1 unnamed protein product [Paramecium tetraurelia]|eukprot:XP_001439575.1 hypothetical protein (macronuclear) [Paramecium tetraurelia strain d4-2]